MAPTTTTCSVSIDRRAPTRSRRRTASAPVSVHPDANPDDPEADAQFKELSKAYAVLSDDQQRARYDQFGEAGVGGAGGRRELRGHVRRRRARRHLRRVLRRWRRRGQPVRRRRSAVRPARPAARTWRSRVAITFEQSVFGDQVPVDLKLPQTCDTCDGSGAGEGTKPVTCSRVQRFRAGSPCPPERARPDGVDEPVPTLRRSR